MWKRLLFCYITWCLLLSQTLAQESQPTTLRGGILKASDNCRTTVGTNARVKMHFTARAWDSEEFFENTYITGPMSFKLGRDNIMEGLEKAIKGMCEGETRRIIIPAEMAFGELGIPDKVPPNTAVVYDVEMLEVDTPLTNPWFWTGLAGIGAVYLIVSRLATQVDKTKAEKFLKKQQEKEQAATSSDKKSD